MRYTLDIVQELAPEVLYELRSLNNYVFDSVNNAVNSAVRLSSFLEPNLDAHVRMAFTQLAKLGRVHRSLDEDRVKVLCKVYVSFDTFIRALSDNVAMRNMVKFISQNRELYPLLDSSAAQAYSEEELSIDDHVYGGYGYVEVSPKGFPVRLYIFMSQAWDNDGNLIWYAVGTYTDEASLDYLVRRALKVAMPILAREEE